MLQRADAPAGLPDLLDQAAQPRLARGNLNDEVQFVLETLRHPVNPGGAAGQAIAPVQQRAGQAPFLDEQHRHARHMASFHREGDFAARRKGGRAHRIVPLHRLSQCQRVPRGRGQALQLVAAHDHEFGYFHKLLHEHVALLFKQIPPLPGQSDLPSSGQQLHAGGCDAFSHGCLRRGGISG